MSSVRSASPASLFWDSPPRGSIGGAPNPPLGGRTARQGEARGANTAGHITGDGEDGDDDGAGFVDLFYIESLMSGPAAPGRGIPPLQQEKEMERVISDSGSAYDDGIAMDSVAGLRRRRGDNGSSKSEAYGPGETR